MKKLLLALLTFFLFINANALEVSSEIDEEGYLTLTNVEIDEEGYIIIK